LSESSNILKLIDRIKDFSMKTEMIINFAVAAFTVFIITALTSKFLIPKLKSLKMGQKILDIGPRWHKNKEGTPTMGGVSFIFAGLVVFAAFGTYLALKSDVDMKKLIICMGFALVNGVIGFVDDFAKFFKKQNQGLKAGQKFFLQLLAAGIFLFVMYSAGYVNGALYIPFIDMKIKLGVAYYILMIVLITGIVNSVNLTDGIDGLASGVTFVVGGFFTVAAISLANMSAVFMAAIVVGSTLGFLVYNFHPAKIFMGDTGSLYLGGMVVSLAFMIDNPFILVPVGIVYICETLSDIIQVSYYKISGGKRIFKMAPIHHHFEKCGWSENKIVFVFSFVTLVFSIVAYFGLT